MVFFFFLHYRFSTARGLGIHMGKLCTPAHLETNTHHQPDKHLLNRSNPINKFDDFFNNWDCLDRIDRKSSGELHWVAHILLLPPSVAWLPPGIGKLGKCLSRGCVTMKLLFLSFFFFFTGAYLMSFQGSVCRSCPALHATKNLCHYARSGHRIGCMHSLFILWAFFQSTGSHAVCGCAFFNSCTFIRIYISQGPFTGSPSS